jgi:hypothetical protein
MVSQWAFCQLPTDVGATNPLHPSSLPQNHPPPTVSFDPNATVASALPMAPLDHRTTSTTSVQQPSAATINSTMNPSVGIPNVVQPFMHSIGRAVAQVSALLRLATHALSQATGAPGNYQTYANPAMHQTPTNLPGAPT